MMNARRTRRTDTAKMPTENENLQSVIGSTAEDSYITSVSGIRGACYPRNLCTVRRGAFVPFDGTVEDFKKTLGFQQMVKRHSFVLVELDAVHCSNTTFGRNDYDKKDCRKGVIVSTFDW